PAPAPMRVRVVRHAPQEQQRAVLLLAHVLEREVEPVERPPAHGADDAPGERLLERDEPALLEQVQRMPRLALAEVRLPCEGLQRRRPARPQPAQALQHRARGRALRLGGVLLQRELPLPLTAARALEVPSALEDLDRRSDLELVGAERGSERAQALVELA